MSGRIETISSRNGNDYKFSKNEIVGARKAGVDIGEDLEAGGAKTAGKVSKVAGKKVGAIGTSGLQENYEEENDNE